VEDGTADDPLHGNMVMAEGGPHDRHDPRFFNAAWIAFSMTLRRTTRFR